MHKVVKIYTDGACRGNPGIGGWGAILHYNQHQKELMGAEELTTNNRMELTAAIQALSALKTPCAVQLTTDSLYLKKGIVEWLPMWKNRGWKTVDRKAVKNIDLWQQLEKETARHTVEWNWIKGHAGHAENERADALANQAIDEWKQKHSQKK